MPNNAVPTLSTFGYVTHVAEKVDFLLAHFVESDKLQTTVYSNNVTSLQWILEEYGASMLDTVAQIQNTVQVYLMRYFTSAVVECNYRDEEPEVSSSRVLITLAITVVQDGKEYQANKLLRVVEGRFKEFARINNEVST